MASGQSDSGNHLDVCATCRELHALWVRMFGDDPLPHESADLPTADPSEWKEARGVGPVLGGREKTTKTGRRGPPSPDHTCPDCGRWKKPEYETCFACSGMVLCESCEENYHHEDYNRCYECR